MIRNRNHLAGPNTYCDAPGALRAGLGAIGPQRRPVAMVVPDCKIVEPQLRQRVAQLAQRLDLRILPGHLAKGLVRFVEGAVLVGGPAHPMPADVVGKPLLAPMRHGR